MVTLLSTEEFLVGHVADVLPVEGIVSAAEVVRPGQVAQAHGEEPEGHVHILLPVLRRREVLGPQAHHVESVQSKQRRLHKEVQAHARERVRELRVPVPDDVIAGSLVHCQHGAHGRLLLPGLEEAQSGPGPLFLLGPDGPQRVDKIAHDDTDTDGDVAGHGGVVSQRLQVVEAGHDHGAAEVHPGLAVPPRELEAAPRAAEEEVERQAEPEGDGVGQHEVERRVEKDARHAHPVRHVLLVASARLLVLGAARGGILEHDRRLRGPRLLQAPRAHQGLQLPGALAHGGQLLQDPVHVGPVASRGQGAGQERQGHDSRPHGAPGSTGD
mmetsp:Transcript_87094/g.246577  ORF Transcript_87094/g.246577 Transcript_87094/m.246577 type:complete len:327 (-) Transcript_87094:49-1029(-)